MNPLSRRTRTSYFVLFIGLFIVLIPISILYAIGYRFHFLGGFSLVETGGIYVSVPQSGAEVSINGNSEGISGLFSRNFYVDNLAPGSYAVHVALPGFYPWYKTLVVDSQIVTDARAFLVPQQIEILKLIRGTVGTTTAASTTLVVSRAQYDTYLTLFSATSSPAAILLPQTKSTTTPLAKILIPEDEQGGLEIYIEKGDIRLHWAQSTTSIPSSLCMTPSTCLHDYLLEKGKETAIRARFWEGGVLYSTKEQGIYLAEADVRPTPLVIPIYPRAGAEFRIVDGVVIIKDGTSLYQVVGF